MTVAELREFLRTFDQNLTVVYRIHSERAMLEGSDVKVIVAQPARDDGWVGSARADKPQVQYLSFPGN